jgi:3-hydroxymyristoyl/3-hydroxydecanoyl-(acyl carrier protein) dehydratase
MLRVEPREGGFSATFKLRPDLSILPDHFRGAPILPGVCMVQIVLLAAAQALNVPDLRLSLLKNAKIMRPIRPNDQVRIEGTVTAAEESTFTIKATFTTESAQRCAEFSLTAAAHLPPLPSGEGNIPGEGRDGVHSGKLLLTRASSPRRTTLSVQPPPHPSIPNPERGAS